MNPTKSITPRARPNGERSRSSHLGFRPDIDGLRAISVIAIVLFHAFPSHIPAGFIGVDIFFVISGYLISLSILEDLSHRHFSFINFYSRRIRRIFPALALVLASCLVAGWYLLLANEYQQLGKHTVGGAFFYSNFLFWSEVGYFDKAAETKPLLHLWSLAIEEQFYIIYPIIIRIGWTIRGSVPYVIASFVAASFFFNIDTLASNATADFYSPFTRFWEIGVGGLLAYAASSRRSPGSIALRFATLTTTVGVFLLSSAFATLTKSTPFPGAWALLPTLAATLIIASGSHAWFNRLVLSNRLLVWIGGISFPLYLWHWPILCFMRIVEAGEPSIALRGSAIALSVVLAWLTTILVERPLRGGTCGGCKVLGLLGSIALLGYLGYRSNDAQGYPKRYIYTKNKEVRSANNQDPRVSDPAACPLSESVGPQFALNCSVHLNPNAPDKVVVWADSNGLSWQPAFRAVAAEQKFQLYVITHAGCPPLPGIRRSDNLNNSISCRHRENTQGILDSIIKTKPKVVVIAARWSMYTNGWIQRGLLNPATHFVTTTETGKADAETSTQALREKLPQLVETLRSHGIKVILLKEPPVLKNENIRLNRDEIETSLDAQRMLAKTSDEIIASIPNLSVYDPADKLCTPRCIAYLGDTPLYFDDSHLNPDGSKLFVSDIAALLRNALDAGAK